jgi:hypothetical protein
MLTFADFLTESLDVDKLKHLEHAEDHIIHGGDEGVQHAADNLDDLHNMMRGKKSKSKVTVKYDGCLSANTKILTDKYGIITLGDLYDKWSLVSEIYTLGYRDGEVVRTKILDKLAKRSNKKWLEIVLENNKTIRLTEDHQVMLVDGRWVQAKDLLPDDDILSYSIE